jgi:tetratricopeptide (TPR) repeat protein
MTAQSGSATNVVQLNAPGRRQPRIVAAARVATIDYRSIVDSAVAGLARNTPDARREVYAQARGVVKRHLQLMRLPEPIVELEKLALDLTIRKIERQWRARQAIEHGIAELDPSPAPNAERVETVTAEHALHQLGQALASLLIALGLRPVLAVLMFILRPLRFLASPVCLAAALPVVGMAIFFVFFVDNNVAYKSLLDGPAAKWLARLDLIPGAPAPRSRAKTTDRVPSAGDAAPARVQAANGGANGTRTGAADAMPTRVRPVGSEMTLASAAPSTEVPAPGGPTASPAAAPRSAAPATAPGAPAAAGPSGASACGSGLSMAERAACAADDATGADDRGRSPGRSLASLQPASQASPQRGQPSGQQSWITKYAAMNGVAMGPLTPPPDGARGDEEEVLVATAPAAGAAESNEPAPIITLPGDQPRPAPPPRTNLIRPANAKVTALVDNGKRAASKGDLDKAVRDFSEAIRIDPKYPDSYSERGQAMFKLGETERAIADYTAALQRDPMHGTALRSRGMAYLYRGSPELALTDLTKVIELADNDPSVMAPIELFYARRSRASILGSKQQYDREIEDYTSLIDSYTRDPMVLDALKANYGDVGAANILATIYRQRATVHIRRQNWERAIADLTDAIPLGSDRGYTALVDRAKIYEGLGQRDQAIADLQNALAVRPGSEEVRLALRRLGAPNRAPARGL